MLPSALPCRPQHRIDLARVTSRKAEFQDIAIATAHFKVREFSTASKPNRPQLVLSFSKSTTRTRLGVEWLPHFSLLPRPCNLSSSPTSPLLLLFLLLLSSSNSYSQTTTQHHLLLHSLALTVGSLISISPRARFLLPTPSLLPSPPSAALPLLSLLFVSNSEHCSSSFLQG